MTSKLVVNTIESDTGISSVSFASSISMSSTSKFFFSAAGIDIGADTNINRPAAGVLGFNINGSEKSRIDSSGRVMIGTTTEGFAEADDLTINSADHGGITIRTPTNKEGNIAFSDTTSGTGEYSGLIRYRHSNNDLGLWTNSNLRLLIDSTGRVLVGTTIQGTSGADELTLSTGGSTGITIRSGSSNDGNLYFAMGTTGNETYRGFIQYEHSNNALRFGTNATERLRITSTGQFVVGNNPTVSSGNIVHIEAPTSFNSGETIVNIEGDNATAGPRLLLHNNNTGASAHGEILGVDAGGQSTSSIRFYNTDQSNNYGEIAFGTRNVSNAPPADRMRISKDGYVTKPHTPAFHVSRRAGDVGNNSYVVFDRVDYNNGGHYNNSNGRFTAPVTGIYFFSAWHFTNSTSAFYLRINGNTYGEYTWDDTGGCGTWVCHMTANQYAQIYTKYTWRGTADYHNAFCGYLIG